MSVSIFSSTLVGVDAKLIEVEVDQRPGLTKYHIVGLADKACTEAKERIKSALRNNGIKLPQCQVIFNLAPANLPKSGSVFDLAMALGLIARRNELPPEILRDYVFLGELALDGGIRPVRGVLAATELAKANGFKGIFVPMENLSEAMLIKDIAIYGVENLTSILQHFKEEKLLQPCDHVVETEEGFASTEFDFASIRGHHLAKRALEIAAVGGHNILLEGPPGSGKTLLAKSLLSIMPKLSEKESIEVIKIHSAAGSLQNQHAFGQRPWRSPHHSASARSLVGGGQNPRPGEISLAHRGILFLDELPEFPRGVLETLRQPLENGAITIARVQQTVEFPANFLLIAAMNPCPCGFATDRKKSCTCSRAALQRYQQKLSGPLLDRFDLFLHIPRVEWNELMEEEEAETSEEIAHRVNKAKLFQKDRLVSHGIDQNKDLPSRYFQQIELAEDAKLLLQQAVESLQLSTRAYYRVLRVARTIADIEQSEYLSTNHLAEALQYRRK